MPEIIKPDVNTTPLTKGEELKSMKSHLLMMLEAMQYKGDVKFKGINELRELVEEQKILYLRKLQHAIEKEHEQKFGVSVHDRSQQT